VLCSREGLLAEWVVKQQSIVIVWPGVMCDGQPVPHKSVVASKMLTVSRTITQYDEDVHSACDFDASALLASLVGQTLAFRILWFVGSVCWWVGISTRTRCSSATFAKEIFADL
jgi:hypothetical protein